VILFGTKAVAEQKGSGDYAPLVREIMKFFQTGISPVPPRKPSKCSPLWKPLMKANGKVASGKAAEHLSRVTDHPVTPNLFFSSIAPSSAVATRTTI
jgi:hypothetical protein